MQAEQSILDGIQRRQLKWPKKFTSGQHKVGGEEENLTKHGRIKWLISWEAWKKLWQKESATVV